MITLSADFITRATAKDTRKIVVAHLFYDDTNFMPVSTVATVIDGTQYMGVLKDMGGASHKWNITGNNSVTINTPKLTLVDYNTPNGYSIITEFNTNTYYGRKLVVYFGYEGQSLSNMLKAFDGIIDEINYDGGEIEITGKSFVFPKVDINASKINYNNQKIGNSTVPAGFKIDKSNDNKYLPVPFGNQWCAPMQPGFYNETTKQSVYSIYDEQYSSLLSKQRYIRQDIYNYNIGSAGASVLLLNDDAYTPLHLQGWAGDNEYTYSIYYNSDTYLNGITIAGTDSGAHRRTDDKFFITVPLRYNLRTDLPDWFSLANGTSDAAATISKVFDNTNSTVFTFYPNGSGAFQASVKLMLDEKKNLCADEKSHIRTGRRISIPSTPSNNGGQGYLLSKYYLGCANSNNPYPLSIRHWKNNYVPATPFTGTDDKRYIGSGDLGSSDGAFTNIKYGARVFNKYSGYAWDYDIFDEDINNLGLQGSFNLNGNMGNDPFILRETLSEPVGASLFINAPEAQSGDEINLWKLFHLTAGEVDLSSDTRVYAAAYGVKLISSNSLLSTPQDTNTYGLQRPYEYIEFLLKDKTINSSFSVDFNNANINPKWNAFFSTSRDGSGFVIDSALTLDKFISEYLSAEPFTVYSAEDGSYQLRMLKKTYITGDTQGTLDYRDATDFNISLTPSKSIISEIKSLKTDFMYDLDAYALDINWRLKSPGYNYSFWKYGNTADKNEFKLDNMDKKYTSYVPVDIVIYGGKHWGCIRTNTNQIPAVDSLYWRELNENIAVNTWSSSTKYFGEDAEQFEIASWYLNQWGNRHRTIKFETDVMSYLQYCVGDVVEFSNVPFTLAGISIKGFNGATNFTSTLNGQTIYASFIITDIQKSLKKVTIEAMQLHDLTAYEIERIN